MSLERHVGRTPPSPARMLPELRLGGGRGDARERLGLEPIRPRRDEREGNEHGEPRAQDGEEGQEHPPDPAPDPVAAARHDGPGPTPRRWRGGRASPEPTPGAVGSRVYNRRPRGLPPRLGDAPGPHAFEPPDAGADRRAPRPSAAAPGATPQARRRPGCVRAGGARGGCRRRSRRRRPRVRRV